MGVGDDNDAAAFLQEAGITDYMQQRAIFELVSRLKGADLWSKMKAIYPFIGGTASTHKWNLKDPRDVDAAFRLSFNGGWTHSDTGADPNGTNGWADTFCAHNTMAQDSIHASGYFGDNIASRQTPALGQDGSPASVTAIYPNYLNGIYTAATGSGGSYITQSITDARAMVLTYRTSSTVQKQKRNDETPITQNHNSVAPGTQNFIIGAGSFSNVKYYNDAQYRFCTIGDGLTDSEASALYTIVDLYQKRLSRAV